MKIFTRACEILCGLTLAFILVFSDYLENNRPTHPMGDYVRQVPVHGDFVYVTQTENLVRVFSWPLFFVASTLPLPSIVPYL